MINIGIGVGWAKALYSVANNVIANFKARVLSYPNSIFEAGPCLDATLEELNAIGLLDNASLVITPNAYNEGILYDVIPNTTLGDMDVVRATTATRVNSAGLIEVVPRNLLTYSEQFENANWVKSGSGTASAPVVSTNSVISPINIQNAEKITFDLNGGTSSSDLSWLYQNVSTIIGLTYTFSAYVKASAIDDIGKQIRIGGITYSNTITLTSSWQRVSITETAALGTNTSFGFRLRGTEITNDVSMDLWGAQVENFTTATEYFPTTTRLNIPRIDYTNGSCPSLLVEPQRTNVVLQSSDLSQTVWSKSNYILTPTSTIQGLIATRITKNAINNGVYNGTGVRNLINTVGTFAAGVKTLSFYIRKGNTDKVAFVINNILVGVSTSVNCEFNFNTKTFTNVAVGLTASFENYNTDVYKIILTINDTGVSTGKAIWIAPIDASNNTVDGGYLDFAFAQWELGSYPTSYIPTVASSVTRNADVISKTGISSLIGQTEGTLFCDVNLNSRANFTYFAIATNLALTNNYLGIAFLNNAITFDSVVAGVLQANIIHSNTSTGRFKIAAAYKANDFVLYINGTQIGVDTSGTVPTCSEIGLSVFNQAQALNYNSAQIYKTRLTNEQCILLTGDTYNSYAEMATNLNYILQ